MSDKAGVKNQKEITLTLVLRSLLVHFTVIILVIIFGILCIILSPLTGGQIIFWAGWLWGTIILRVAGVKLEVENADAVIKGEPQIIVGNHTSNFDIYVMLKVLIGHYYRILCKKELKHIPIFGWALWAGGFPFLDRSHHELAMKTMEKVAAMINRKGMSILAFPEGTRNRQKQMMPFKKGAFLLAIEGQIPVAPFIIDGAWETQSRHSFIVRPGTIKIKFLPRVETTGLTYDDRDALIEKIHSSMKGVLEKHEEPSS